MHVTSGNPFSIFLWKIKGNFPIPSIFGFLAIPNTIALHYGDRWTHLGNE